MAGEIATAFVRIRPNAQGFKQTAEAEVKGALKGVQESVNASARANVASTQTEIRANEALGVSYKEVQAIAQANVATLAEGVTANKLLAAAYTEVGVAAKAGSVEQILATKLATEATIGAATTVQQAAAANVAATVREITANEELAASYGVVAAAAAKGSQEQIVAMSLAARASAAAAAETAGAAGVAAGSRFAGGVKHGLGLGGELFGVGIGTAFLVEFTKKLSEQAAEVQKSEEVVRAEFGKSAEEIEAFAKKGAADLGITDDAALGTAAKFGILFQNLGIGHEVAAEMTVNLEKLAGSLSAIRGVDPSVALRTLNLAMLGNVRGLKQLGIAIDPATIKFVAFKEGLISSVKDGITPAVRAQAIYAIATQNLSKWQALAAEHADDLANRQRRLSAQWDDAKDKLGADLLPAFAAFTGGLAKLLAGFLALPAAAKGAIAAIVGIGVAIGAVALGLSPIIGIPAAIIALGLAFNEAYQHSQKFRDGVHQIGESLKPIVPVLEDTKDSLVQLWATFGNQFSGIAKTLVSGQIKVIIDQLKIVANTIAFVADVLTGKWGKAWQALKNIVSAEFDLIKTKIQTTASVIEGIFGVMWKAIEILFVSGIKGISDLLAKIPTKITIFGHTIGTDNPFKSWSDGLQATLDGLTNAPAKVATVAKQTQSIFASSLTVPDPSSATAAQKFGAGIVDNIGKGAKDALSGGAGKTLAEQAAEYFRGQGLSAASGKAATALQKARDAVRQAEQDLATLNGRLKTAIAKTGTDVLKAVEDAKANLATIGQSLGQSISTIIDQPFVLAGQKIQDAQDRITLIFDRKSQKLQQQAAAIQRQQSAISAQGDRLALENLRQQVVLPSGHGLDKDPKKALAELQALSKSASGGNKAAIDAFIIQFRSASLQVAQDKVSLKQSALDAKKTVLTNALQLKSELLQVEQDTANRLKTQITTQIADLTDAFNRHVITYAQFKKGIEDIISKGRPAMKKAGATLGTAFANQYMQQVDDILKQAGFIANGPQVAGTTGQDHKIVNPSSVLRKDQAAVERIRTQIANKQTKLQEKLVTEAKKQTAFLQTLAQGKGAKTSGEKNPGKQTKNSEALVGANGD